LKKRWQKKPAANQKEGDSRKTVRKMEQRRSKGDA